MRLKVYSLLLFIIVLSSCKAQENIYVFSDRYNTDIKNLNKKSHYNLKPIKILGQYMIDPSRKGNVNYDLVVRYLNKLYPDKNQHGLLAINLEGKLFKQLRDDDLDSETFRTAEKEFIRLIRFIKNKVPFIKVGVYGLPFKGYYESQLKKNERERLDRVLKEIDVLMPSLYIAYPAKQKSQESNIDYLNKNLNIAFAYGERLEKPIYPFFWYLVHPSNNKYGSAFIPKDELVYYMNHIFKSNKIKGIIWWDTPTPFKNNTINAKLLPEEVFINDINQAFEFYLYK